MACIPAPACKAALREATKLWPGRRTTSDGVCSSLKHRKQNPNSDHDYGNAFDLSHDPANGVDCNDLALLVAKDGRVKYVIWNRRIWNPSVSPEWRGYYGSNPHTQHMHVSIKPQARDDTSPWFVASKPTPKPEDDMTDAEKARLFDTLEALSKTQTELHALLKSINHEVAAPKAGRLYRIAKKVGA